MKAGHGAISTRWRMVIRYREGSERLIQGLATNAEAVNWIEANVGLPWCGMGLIATG
jgi:hypothetical protein